MPQQLGASQARSPGQLVRRYGLAAYWLAFAAYTVEAGRHPGFVPDPASVPYPWSGVIATWALLAVFTGVLHLILRPRTFHRSWGRLAGALAFSLVLLAATVLTMATDMPGYVYVPAAYALVTFAALLLLGLGLAISPRSRRSGSGSSHAPAP